MMLKLLVLNDRDNVGVLLEKAAAGDICNHNGYGIEILEDVDFGHKIALKNLSKDDVVYKYGEEIGYMLCNIEKGQWIHNHNMGCRRGK